MPSPHQAIGSNSMWLTFLCTPEPLLIQTSVLGLGADRSLLCALPDRQFPKSVKSGISCKGRCCIDGELYEFETNIQEILRLHSVIRLAAPQHIIRQAPRSFPRLTVALPGVVRPLHDNGHILAVLPVQLNNLSPTGCQFTMAPSTWPKISSGKLHISCRLPGFSHHSRFLGFIEWRYSAKDLRFGLKFLFASPQDPPFQDVNQWYASQQAQLIHTTA